MKNGYLCFTLQCPERKEKHLAAIIGHFFIITGLEDVRGYLDKKYIKEREGGKKREREREKKSKSKSDSKHTDM